MDIHYQTLFTNSYICSRLSFHQRAFVGKILGLNAALKLYMAGKTLISLKYKEWMFSQILLFWKRSMLQKSSTMGQYEHAYNIMKWLKLRIKTIYQRKVKSPFMIGSLKRPLLVWFAIYTSLCLSFVCGRPPYGGIPLKSVVGVIGQLCVKAGSEMEKAADKSVLFFSPGAIFWALSEENYDCRVL